MPHVEVSPEVLLYYEISPCDGEVTQRKQRPWLMILHPLMMDSYYSRQLSEDQVIRNNFNQVLFDIRYHGRSQCPPSATVDMYTLAADLALALEKLEIPAVHAIGTHSWSSEILLRMAAVFPDSILSLCLCGVPPPTDQPHIQRAFQECFQCFTAPESVEDWDEAAQSIFFFFYSNSCDDDEKMLDEFGGILLRRYPPCRSVESMMSCAPFLMRDIMPEALNKSITQPVLCLRGDLDSIYPEDQAQTRLKDLPDHPLHTVQTIPGAALYIPKTHSAKMRTRYMAWVQPILDSKAMDGFQSRRTCWKKCLEKLALACGDESIAGRNPSQSSSYYRKSDAEVAGTFEMMEKLAEAQTKSFSLMGGGAPEIWTGSSFEEIVPWRFSARFDDARMGPKATTSKVSDQASEVLQSLAEVQLDQSP